MNMNLIVLVVSAVIAGSVYSADVSHFSIPGHHARQHTERRHGGGGKSRGFLSRAHSHPFLKSIETAFLGRTTKGLTFSLKNCGDLSKTQVFVKSVTLKPDPIKIPGTATVSFAVTFNSTIDAPLQVALEVKKHEPIIGWVTIPCIDGIGSCTYSDVCEQLSGADCPLPFVQNKIPCKCPFKKGDYSLSNVSFDIPKVEVPSGRYQMEANMSMKGTFVGCIQMQASLD